MRYIPFSVMAGFLASTGWLMTSGALNIIAGTPLTLEGLARFQADPMRPEIAAGVIIALVLFMAARVPQAVLIPVVMGVATLTITLFLQSGLCRGAHCTPEAWLFADIGKGQWRAPWDITLSTADLMTLFESLPSMLVVAFVGVLTVLLSVASLELTYRREFDLNRITRLHALVAGVAALSGGFAGVISIGRTSINRSTGGGALANTVSAALCLATLLGAGPLIAHVPRAALGGLVLFLGLGMLKQWLWDQRRTMSALELGQILLILALVANFGFMVGFSAGLMISCIVFVVTYSRLPLTNLATNLSLVTSAVARPKQDMECLRAHGAKTLLYRMGGYVFFGSASKIESVFRDMDTAVEAVILDFSKVSGFDSSAIGVFQRILRRYHGHAVRFHFVHGEDNTEGVYAISPNKQSEQIVFHASLDHALEMAEEDMLGRWASLRDATSSLAFLGDTTQQVAFLAYCDQQNIARGALLCAEHDLSDEIFFIASGSLEVVKAAATGTVRLAKLHAGAMVGELAFYTGEARTAAIAAATEATVYILSRDSLAKMRTEDPALAHAFDHMVIRKISRALSQTNKLVALYR